MTCGLNECEPAFRRFIHYAKQLFYFHLFVMTLLIFVQLHSEIQDTIEEDYIVQFVKGN